MKRYWLFCIPFILLFLFSLFILGGILLPLTNQQSACTSTEDVECAKNVQEQVVYAEEMVQEEVLLPDIEYEAPEPDRIGNLIVIDSDYAEVHCCSGFNRLITYTAYDEVELVMYQIIIRSTGAESGITITPLYKADGTLRTYTPEE